MWRWPLSAGGGLTVGQYARLLTGLLWFAWADWVTTSTDRGFIPFLAVLLAATSIAVMALAVTVRGEAAQRRFDQVLLIGSVAIVALVGAAGASTRALGTDEVALDQGAAIRLLHGINPYTADLSFALHQFGVSVGTVTLNGGIVSTASYPPLSFLLYVPAVALLGVNSYASELVNLACWGVAAMVLWRLTAARVRAWLPLFFALPVFFGPVTGGNVDTLALPFVLVALFSWDRYGDPAERGVARWIGPVALGAACAVKQNPWLLVPFLTIGVALEARARRHDWLRTAARYASTVGVVFLVLNLPFIVWNPGAWVSKLLLPVTGGLIPSGIGPVDLMRSYGIGGGNLALFTVAALCARAAALLLYVWRYASLKRLVPLLPLAALMVSSRSLTTYFAFSVPALAVAASSVRGVDAHVFDGRLRTILGRSGAVCAAASVTFLGGALLTPAPLHLTVVRATETSALFTAQVRVDNRDGRALSPHFVLAQGRDFRVPLTMAGGPQTLQGQSSATYILTAPAQTSMLQPGNAFQVQAVTASPGTISVTPAQQAPPVSALR